MQHSLNRPVVDPWAEACPSREVLGTLASKWVLLVIPLLRVKPLRNNDLMRRIPGISQKMLTQTLRDLESKRLVERHDFQEVPPRVEYALTALGRSLEKAIKTFDEWVIANYYEMEDFERARA
jgi:DNA-binding HxlR family transcriptional regulator